ncbi:MAG: ABC transporter permease [Anaerolineales bacterium]|nr:ABC transporter permease [Anaerolineales bacterium]
MSARSRGLLAPSLFKVAGRYLLTHPLQSLLMLIGIAMGVGVAVSVDIANASAAQAFELSTEAVAGKATHYISAGPLGLDEQVYVDLRTAGLELPMAPVLSQLVTSPQLGDAPLQLMGIDPFAERPFRNYIAGDAGEDSPSTAMGAFYAIPGAVLLSTQMASEFNLSQGDPLELQINGISLPAVVAGLLQPRDNLSAQALQGLLLADLATVQEFSGRLGRLERIDLILPSQNRAAIIADLESRLPEGAVVLQSESRNQSVEQMTAAFRTNITALSLLGLVVGVFLIYNTVTFSVVQRRQSFGTLRALGVSSREIFVLVLGEALLVGVIGSLAGLALGILMGRGSVAMVSQTINDVFYTMTVREVSLPAQSLVKGALLGMLATLVAAIIPAWEAAKSPPRRTLSRSQLESISRRTLAQASIAGALLSLASAFALARLDLQLIPSFGAMFGVVIGAALVAPFIMQVGMPLLARVLAPLIGPLGRLAPREVSASASRTSPAMAALMVAVAVTIGGSLMVSSFRASVVNWMEIILQNDVYGSVAGANLSEPQEAIDLDALRRLETWPGIEATYYLRNVMVDSPYGPLMIAANNNPNDGDEQVYYEAEGSGQEVWQAVQNGAVMISEPLANRLELGLGDEITLYTPNGPRGFHIAAVFSDYTSSRGNITMWLENYRQIWNDESVTAFSAVVTAGTDVDGMVAELQRGLSPQQLLHIRSNSTLRAESLSVFDRTFLISSALQLITTNVAFVGVLSAMLSLQLEKQRQMGILKAIGLTVRQIWSLTLLETGLIGALAGLLALPMGLVIAQVLLTLINRRSFGWTLQLHFESQPFIEALLLAIAAALLAGLYPAWRASRRSAADAMRFD